MSRMNKISLLIIPDMFIPDIKMSGLQVPEIIDS